MKFLHLTMLLLFSLSVPGFAQDLTPQLFDQELSFGSAADDVAEPELSAVLVPTSATSAELRVTLSVPEDFYVYSMDRSFGGHTAIELTDSGTLTPAASGWKAIETPKSEMDPYLEQRVEKFMGGTTWVLPMTSSAPLTADSTVQGNLRGQYCGSGEFGICKPINPPLMFSAPIDGEIPAASAPAASESAAARVQITPELRHNEPDQSPPIQFEMAFTPENPRVGDEVTLSVTATLGKVWHTYALDQDEESGAGTPTEITLYEAQGLEPVTPGFVPTTEPKVKVDFGITQRSHYGTVTWNRTYRVTSESVAVEGGVLFQLCTEHNCLAPTETEFKLALQAAPGTAGTEIAAGTPETPAGPGDDAIGAAGSEEFSSHDPRARGLLVFILSAFGAGALALLTPCVFPMIPVTVAFFLKQSESKHGNAVVLAAVYSASIVLAFTVLGVVVAAIFGPQTLTDAANNPWLNLFFAALFTVFGFSLMGMFELRVPNFLLTWSSSRESVGGLAGVVFMALTFTLVSFTCTFAFLGPILVWAAQGELFWPIIGMLSFSSAFATPFFLLAIFPSLLKKLPKSGGWLNSVKVTMAFVEFALVLKFLSVADIGLSSTGLPHWIDAQGFLVCWMMIAAITGMYLLGLFRMSHDMPMDGVSPVRCVIACGFLCFSGYLAVGMFGTEEPRGWLWEQVVAFAPPEFDVDQSGSSELMVVHDDLNYHLDLAAAIAESQAAHRPLFIDFTGVNCVNCRKMEKTVLNKDVVLDVLGDCVRAQLFVDLVPISDKELADQILETNQELQREWFGDVTMPAYAIVSSDGTEVLARYKNLDTTGGVEFRRFLDAGLERWRLQDGSANAVRTASQSEAVPITAASFSARDTQ